MLKEKAALGGAIAAAFAGSLCCIAPLVFVLLGFGTLGAAAIFEPLRPYLLGGAVLFLALAYYWIYFKRPASASSSCASGESCEASNSSRASRLGLWLATFAVVLFTLLPYITAPLLESIGANKTNQTDNCCIANKSSKSATSGADNPPAGTKRVSFKIAGMTCVTCEPAIRFALEKTPGVKRAVVSYERGDAVVEYDPAETYPEKLREAINATGYEVVE